MSRVGRRPITIPQGVTVEVQAGLVKVKGPKGELTFAIPSLVQAKVEGKELKVTRDSEEAAAKARHGLVRNLLNNMVEGVTKGFTKDLEIQGVGFRAEVKGKILQIALGFSHPVLFPIPEGIQIQVVNQTKLSIHGEDRVRVGQTAAEIRGLKIPEPYQGKGVRYAGEVIKRKVGKAAAGAQGA